MKPTTVFTSESVCAGHPDKLSDQISDAILDAALQQDPRSRVAVETLVTVNQTVLAGEVTTSAKLDFAQIARDQIKRLGYTNPAFGYTHQSPITVYIHQQSPEIAVGVDSEGAGDQGMMFGYACRETDNLMPLPIEMAHRLAERIDEVRESNLTYLRPDGKTQVTVQYDDERPVAVKKLVLAVPHSENIELEQVSYDLYQQVVQPVLSAFGFDVDQSDMVVNGTGVWHVGGPSSDTGLTGRKIVVDTYGGYARVGGGCFSGKDPTKVDRSGAYAARYLAKNIVARGLADRAEVGLAYCIGHAQPVMKTVETFGTQHVNQRKIASLVDELLDTSVAGIIHGLNLRRPIYLQTAAYGHFGRAEFPWEHVTT